MANNSPFKTTEQRQRFSRKTLNIIIITVSIMIVLFYNMPGAKIPDNFNGNVVSNTIEEESTLDNNSPDKTEEQQTQTKPFIPEDHLSSLALIAKATPNAHSIDIQSWNTTKGAQVLFVEASEVPMLDIRLVFNAGGARDPKTLPGLALLTNGMITEGSKTHNVDEIAAHFESLGAVLKNGSYRDMATLSLRTLSDNDLRQKALEVFYGIISTPTFPNDSFQRLLKQLTLGLKHEKQNPKQLVNRQFFQSLYPDHPYGHRTQGTDDSLKKITINDLKEFYSTYYVSSNMVIAITGDIQRNEAETIANAIDSTLKQGSPAPRLPTPASLVEKQDHFIEFPSSQSHVLMGTLGIKRGNDDWPALVLGNRILGGGGFGSRLTKTIRQDKGLVYSVYSNFSAMAVNGPFIMGLQTKNASRQEASELMLSILNEFISQGPTEKELTEAKQHLLGNFPLNIASNSSIVGYLGTIGFYNLPLDYLEMYPKKLEKVTINDIKKAFEKNINRETLITIALGKKDITEEKVR